MLFQVPERVAVGAANSKRHPFRCVKQLNGNTDRHSCRNRLKLASKNWKTGKYPTK
jgi:hypothetical protein